MHREVSFETLSNNADIFVPFSFSLKENLEDYFEKEKLYTIVSKLTNEQKEILELKILYNYNSKEIAQQLNTNIWIIEFKVEFLAWIVLLVITLIVKVKSKKWIKINTKNVIVLTRYNLVGAFFGTFKGGD